MAVLAQFDGICDACGDWIEEGDEITRDPESDNWVHADCVEG